MQREYWTIVYFSLLISISAFLLTSVWKDRRSPVPAKGEVTVELDGKSTPGAVEPGEGAYFAVVQCGSTEAGEQVEYVVKRLDNNTTVTVRRELLRHRKWHRIAFLQFTNDKQHDGWSTQAFASRRQQFFQILQDQGHDAAIAFARDDMAERERAKEQAQLDAKRAELTAAAKTAADAAEAAAATGTDPDDDEEADAAAVAAAAAAAADKEACIAAAAIAANFFESSSVYRLPVPRAARRQPSEA
eukprot:4345132-Prymnesium_polylepis.1